MKDLDLISPMEKNHHLKVLMLPWLAHGHISPFLELAKRLSTRNFHIYICSTPVNLTSVKKKLTGKYSDSIELVELHLPSSPELPPHYHTTNGLPPHLMTPLKIAYEKSIPQFSDILTSLLPDLVIYDFNQYWAPELASGLGIPAIQFMTAGASILSFAMHFLQNPGKPFPHSELYLTDLEFTKLRSQGGAEFNGLDDKDRFLRSVKGSTEIVLVKSCGEIEGKYLDALSDSTGKKIVPTGPLVQESSPDDDSDEDREITAWLDRRIQGSVVYASFGSEYFLSRDELEVISQGLEMSEVDFIWVVRFPHGDKTSVVEALPEGFLERTKNRGVVVQGWAPQAKILKHPGTGAFLSHCGWSSVMESMKWGVPIVAVPMHIDQPLNARVVGAVGVGVEAVRDEKGDLRGEEIAGAIRKVMVEESGEEVRRKAKEVSEKLEKIGDEEIGVLVDDLIGLCKNKGPNSCHV